MFLTIFEMTYFNNPLILWVYALLVLISAVILSQLLLFFSKNFLKKLTAKTKSDVDDILVDLAEEPLAFFVIILGFFFGYHFLQFPQNINDIFYGVIKVLIMLNAIWFSLRFVDSFFERIIKPITEKSKSKLDDQLVPWIKKSIKIALAFLGVIIILDNMGVDVIALLAGLGIGGIAFAFAAQKTIADAFGGISILFSRPFIVGDKIKFSGGTYEGRVEEIGLRHTKVRDPDKQLIIVPNSILSGEILTNITESTKKKIVLNIGLSYETKNERIDLARKIIENAITSCELCDDDYSIHFTGFGASSIDFKVTFHTKTAKSSDMNNARDIVGLKIKKEFDAEKIEFAYPTQTVYLKQ